MTRHSPSEAELDALTAWWKSPLDVDRLAEAMNNVRPYGGNPSEWAKVAARQIAAEYARLGAASDERRERPEAVPQPDQQPGANQDAGGIPIGPWDEAETERQYQLRKAEEDRL